MAASDTSARTRQIMRALKATVPGVSGAGGFSTATGPSISPGPSPLVASYGEWTSGRASGTRYSLPRDPATFLSGMFGPLAPIQTIPVDTPQPGEDRPEPRRFEYPVSWNMPMGMPGTEGLGKLANFQTLRTLADLYSVARACIELRKSELRGIGWDIVMTRNAAKANRGDTAGMADFAERRAKAVKFFRRPDPQYSDFSSWFDCLLEEVFVTDALALYIQPALGKKGSGLLGSNVAALDLIDGSLIRPLVDIRGGRPVPPNPAFQQFLYGVPRVDLMTLLLGEDNPDEKALVAEYAADQLLYLPYSQRTWTPYGQAPIERAIIPVMTGLNKQQYQLNFFQEGSIPGLFVSPGDTNMTPAQIRELQDALNALAGDQAWKHKIIVLPGGSKVDPQKPVTLADQFDEIVMTQVCMAFSVMPMELGISPKTSTTQSTGAANQMAKASQDIQERRGTVPLLLWLKAAVFDTLIQGVCGQDDMEWQWEGLEEDEDAETLSNLLVQQIGAGLRSIDEGRQELGLDPWNLPVTSDPGWATPMGGFVSFTVPPPAPPALPGQPPAPGQPGKPPAPGAQPAQPQQPAKPVAAKPAAKPVAAAGQPRSALTAPSTPAHSAARATPDAAGAKPGAGSGNGATSRRKAQGRELDLLAGYLRKGGDPAAWQFRAVPGHLAAIIAEDLTKGLSADQVIGAARASLTDGPAPALPVAAGLAVVAADTGRVLMLQRAWDDTDPASGSWEFPGGCLEPGEGSWAAAVREWQEETGRVLPGAAGRAGGWSAASGVYDGHITVVHGEDEIPLHDRGEVINPDDPDGDQFEALAWRDPGVIGTSPDVRTELHGDARHVLAAIALALAKPVGGVPAVKAGHGSEAGQRRPKVTVPAWEHDQAVAARFAAELAAGLRSVISSRALARTWIARASLKARRRSRGDAWEWLAGTALGAAITSVLTRVLSQLWAEGYRLGQGSAGQILAEAGHDPAAALAALADDVDRVIGGLTDAAGPRIAAMAGARLEQLAAVLETATEADEGEEAGAGPPVTAETLEAELEDVLGSVSDALAVTQTEVTWSLAEGMLGVFYQMGVTETGWLTAMDARVCAYCLSNQGAGFIKVGDSFPSGDTQPPGHVRCRCCLIPGDISGTRLPFRDN